MMTASRMKTGGSIMTYFAAHLQERAPVDGGVEDYYAGEGDLGHWVGGGLARMGLIQDEVVTSKDFQMLAAGMTPDGREKLAQNAGDSERRAGMDLTFSAPKSVSVLWAVADREQREVLENAHERAVKTALKFLEGKAFLVRTGKEGAVQQRAKMIAALFQHGTSREQDPQLHTHAFVMNLGVREDGKTSSIDPITIMRWQKVVGAAYRVELAENLRQAGLAVERDGEAFRVAGVDRELEAEFSKRRAQILERLDELGFGGAKAAQHAALETRRAKDQVEVAQLREEWAARASGLGLTAERAAELANGVEPPRLAELVGAAELLEKITTNEAIFRDRELYLAAMEAAQTAGNLGDAKLLAETARGLAVELIHPVTGEVVYTTREMLQAERDVLQIARQRASDPSHALSVQDVERAIQQMESERSMPDAPFRLRDEQRAAVLALTTRQGATQVLVGDAGTGKSTALEAVQRAYSSQGYTVLGAALAGKAAAGLSSDAGIDAKTIDRLLFDIDQDRVKLGPKTVLVVDEAGMVDSRKLVRLSRLAEQSGAKLILVGDHKQLQPVGAGATFRHLAAELHAARLEHITRQREEWARTAVREMSRGDAAAAMRRYIEEGQVQVATTHRAAVRKVASQYLLDRSEVGADKCQITASTNAAVRDINDEIRAALKKTGEIASPIDLRVRESRSDEVRLETLELAVGERVVVTRNLNAIGLKNGDFATVLELAPDRLVLQVDRLQEPIEVRPEEVSLRHGYCATTHKLQGATVERAVVLGSEHTSREMAYVQASRSRGECTWVFSAAKIQKIELEIGEPGESGETNRAVEEGRVTGNPTRSIRISQSDQQPTEGMLKWAQDLHKKGKGPEIAEPNSFEYVREYLNQFSGKEIQKNLQSEGLEQPETAASQVAALRAEGRESEADLLERLDRVIGRMAASRQKDSTLDWQQVTRAPVEVAGPDEAWLRDLERGLQESARVKENARDQAQQRQQQHERGRDGMGL